MDCSNAINTLVEYLLAGRTVPDEVKAHVAGCRACIEELDAISTTLTGEPSTLETEADKLLTCQECLDTLEVYVEDQVAGADVAQRYPKVAHHLQHCVSCREQYAMLHELLEQEKRGTFGSPPSYLTFETWFQQQAHLPLAEPAARAAGLLWEQFSQQVYRLRTEIPILIGEAAATFGTLASPLAPRKVFVEAHQTRKHVSTTEEGEELIELVKLPHPEANLVMELAIGPATANKAALSVGVSQAAPEQPILRARITLYDADHKLLASTLSGQAGIATFDEVDLGHYIIQVKHEEQRWEVPISLAPTNANEDPA